jgi:TolA-binding protein
MTPAASAHPGSASADFRSAMAALDRGDSRDAADEFARFARNYPVDDRAEDAAYLRVVALRRCGDPGATKQAATEYLRRYPAGFRRTEVEGLSR